MVRAKLPKRLGLAGIAIGLGFMTFAILDYEYDFFHGSPPEAYSFIGTLAYTLVPGMWVGMFTFDMGNAAGVIAWVLASLLNFPIYYYLELAISAIWGKLESRRSRAGAPPA